MKAIVLNGFGGLEALTFQDIPKPKAGPGMAVIKIMAFGINHAEIHMRRGEWAEAAPVSGIECVGIIDECPGGEFTVGAKVVALMGGLGRTINGSYAEYTAAPVTNIATIESNLSWAQLAALPESYATAWTTLFRNLKIQKGQTILIRGATSSLGTAAVKLAINAGLTVIATTRTEARFGKLLEMGVSRCEVERPDLSTRLREAKQLDAVLDLVGNSTMLDSLSIVRRDGKVCLAGWLGGLAPIPEFNPLLQMPSGVDLTFFGSFVFGTPGFPVSEIPFQSIAADIEAGKFSAEPARVFQFSEIREAHRVVEANESNGKLVVVHSESI